MRCFPEATGEAYDVVYFASEETHQNLTGVPEDPVHKIWIATCVEGPGHWLREDANEPNWFTLARWVDAPELAELLGSRGRPVETMTFDRGGNGNSYGFEARDQAGRLIGGALFASAGVGAPPPADFVSCEPVEHRGRSLLLGSNGSLHALDWTKQEATCLGAASISWEEDTEVAQILGPGDSPNWVFMDQVEQAQFTWRVLDAP